MITRRTRDYQIDRAAKAAYWGSRRPRRAKIMQVPAANPKPGRQTMRPVVVPYVPRPIDWEAARERGKAYARVLDSQPMYDREFEAEQKAVRAKITALRIARKAAGRARKVRKAAGEWWQGKFADAVDRRSVITVPSHSRRYEPKERAPEPAKESEPAAEA